MSLVPKTMPHFTVSDRGSHRFAVCFLAALAKHKVLSVTRFTVSKVKSNQLFNKNMCSETGQIEMFYMGP